MHKKKDFYHDIPNFGSKLTVKSLIQLVNRLPNDWLIREMQANVWCNELNQWNSVISRSLLLQKVGSFVSRFIILRKTMNDHREHERMGEGGFWSNHWQLLFPPCASMASPIALSFKRRLVTATLLRDRTNKPNAHYVDYTCTHIQMRI